MIWSVERFLSFRLDNGGLGLWNKLEVEKKVCTMRSFSGKYLHSLAISIHESRSPIMRLFGWKITDHITQKTCTI